MNIGEMLINKKVIEEAKKLQAEIIEKLDNQLLTLHYSMIGKTPMWGLDSESLEKGYISLCNLRKWLSVPTEYFINADIKKILAQVPNEFEYIKIELQRLLNERADK